jgi:hypothetical protein
VITVTVPTIWLVIPIFVTVTVAYFYAMRWLIMDVIMPRIVRRYERRYDRSER